MRFRFWHRFVSFSLWSELVDELLDIEFSDIVLDEGLSEIDGGDLNFGFFWDEIHLSFSFLLVNKKKVRK